MKKTCQRKKLSTASKTADVKAMRQHYQGDLKFSSFKELEISPGFFNFPEDHQGPQDCGKRKFVIFYFDDEGLFEEIVGALGKPGKGHSGPIMDTDALIRLLRDSKGNQKR